MVNHALTLFLAASMAVSGAPKKEKTKTDCSECMTRDQADAILKELKEIRAMLENQAAGRAPEEPKVTVTMPAESVPLGAKSAPLTLVEFSDYQCGFCRKFHLETLPELKKRYVDTGLLRVYSLDLPLSFHSNAFKAAVAARCAGEQGRFWEMRDVMVANANNLAPDSILKFAQGLKMDMTPFKQCFDSAKYDGAIRNDAAEAGKIGIEGTPSFVLGRSTPAGVEGVVVVGAQPLVKFTSEIEKLK